MPFKDPKLNKVFNEALKKSGEHPSAHSVLEINEDMKRLLNCDCGQPHPMVFCRASDADGSISLAMMAATTILNDKFGSTLGLCEQLILNILISDDSDAEPEVVLDVLKMSILDGYKEIKAARK